MPSDAFDLTGRVAIVTGAGSGIGRGTALVLAAAGVHVVCADIDGDAAADTSTAIVSAGGSAAAAAVDVARRADLAAVVSATASEHGRLDIMANIAGIIHDGPVLDLTEADLDRVLAVNLKGVLFGCQEAGAVMRRQGAGSIVNMASGAIDAAPAGLVSYSISKAGVVEITRTLARELGPDGVRVNAIAPGLVETNLTRRHYAADDGSVDEARREAFLKGGRDIAPLRRVGTPEDIAYAVLYLASDAAQFTTGQVLRPNGGTSMPG